MTVRCPTCKTPMRRLTERTRPVSAYVCVPCQMGITAHGNVIGPDGTHQGHVSELREPLESVEEPTDGHGLRRS